MSKRYGHKGLAKNIRALTDEVGPEDGVDPRYDRGRSMGRQHTHRKVFQLCGQVARALNLALSCAGDPALQSIQVSEVIPAPDASRLEVRLEPTHPEGTLPPGVMERVTAATPWLRTEVAGSITRKKVPELAFKAVEPRASFPWDAP